MVEVDLPAEMTWRIRSGSRNREREYFPGSYGSYPELLRSAHERTQPPALSLSAPFERPVSWRLGTVYASFELLDGTENMPAASKHSPYVRARSLRSPRAP